MIAGVEPLVEQNEGVALGIRGHEGCLPPSRYPYVRSLTEPQLEPAPPGVVGLLPENVGAVGKGLLDLVDDEAWDSRQALDEDQARIERAELCPQLSLTVGRNLAAKDHDVELDRVESLRDVVEVVRGADLIAEPTEMIAGVAEHTLALPDEKHSAPGAMPFAHAETFRSARLTRSASVAMIARAIRGSSRIAFMNAPRGSLIARTGVAAVIVAERGAPSKIAISPK